MKVSEREQLLCDMNLLLRVLQSGKARFEPSTKEFCFNGLRYSARDNDWRRLIAVIGLNNLRSALDGGNDVSKA